MTGLRRNYTMEPDTFRRVEVITGWRGGGASGIMIRLGTGFDDGDLRRVLGIVRELA